MSIHGEQRKAQLPIGLKGDTSGGGILFYQAPSKVLGEEKGIKVNVKMKYAHGVAWSF